jgi:hypothetical protein
MAKVNTANDIKNPDAVRQRLIERSEPVTESGCWIWLGAQDASGYGHIGVQPSSCTNAHRASYVLFNGDIPAGMVVRHKCNVTSCVNPAHLTYGTHQDNKDDSAACGRIAKGMKHGKTKLSPEVALWAYTSPLSERAVAKEIGCHRSTINAIRSGKSWSHLTGEAA